VPGFGNQFAAIVGKIATETFAKILQDLDRRDQWCFPGVFSRVWSNALVAARHNDVAPPGRPRLFCVDNKQSCPL
jgi:hypothetical protein